MKIESIGLKSHPGWSGALPHYRIDCKRHGIIYTYEMGWKRRVECPICIAVKNP